MFDRATWRGIAIGVVSTAIGLYIVDPLVRYFPSMVLRVAGAMSEGWTDAIYREAAQPEPIETLSVLMLPLLVVSVITFGGHVFARQAIHSIVEDVDSAG